VPAGSTLLFGNCHGTRPGHMASRTLLVALTALLASVTLGCGLSISEINAHPTKLYQQKVRFTGQLARRQDVGGRVLLEVADTNGSRILVRVASPVEAAVDDWIVVEGLLVPEIRVDDRVLYDVVEAEHVTRTRAPRLRNLM